MSQLRKLKEKQIRESQELERARQTQELEQARQTQEIQQASRKRQTQQNPQVGQKRRTQDIPLSKDEEVAEIKLKNAFKLMKEERFGAARHILRDLPDNPKAQQMMAFMEGKTEKRKGPAAVSKWGVFIVVFIVLAVGGAIVLAQFVNSAMSQFTLDELFTQGMGGGDMALYNSVISYCTYSTDFAENKCLQWPIEAFTEHSGAIDACFAPYVDKPFLDRSDVQPIRNCLNRHGVPAPY